MPLPVRRETLGYAPYESRANLPRVGEIFEGKYRIEGALGQGGMAVVLLATHLNLDEHVAIKLLLPHFASDPDLSERFMREGRAATKIRSEHVVRVHDVGVLEDRAYLVMEYLDGQDLEQVLREHGPLRSDIAIDYLLQACEAIAEAHVGGIIHRDLKPANLFLTRRADGSPCVKVLDFGISKTARPGSDSRITQPTMVMGSPHYMSPEQLRASGNVDERSDIWALGAILHELVAGAPPFNGETITALCAKILSDAPASLSALRSDAPRALEAAVLRCLQKEPARRFANVAELALAIAPLGSASARASALRIARVLESAKDRRESLPRSRSYWNARRSRAHALAYAVVGIALVIAGLGARELILERETLERDRAREDIEAKAPIAEHAPEPLPRSPALSTPVPARTSVMEAVHPDASRPPRRSSGSRPLRVDVIPPPTPALTAIAPPPPPSIAPPSGDEVFDDRK